MSISRPNRLLLAAFAAAVLAACAALADSARAAWPGSNGPIVFAGGTATQGNGLWTKKLSWKGIRHTTLDSSDREPQSSPDGRRIVFVRSVEVPLPGGGGTFPARHIFTARADGTGARPLTGGPNFDQNPSFAPSGKRILFARFAPGAEDADIYGIRLDGTGLHQITSGAPDDRHPVFSPNRRIIAFDRFEEGRSRHIYTMRPDGSNIREATFRIAAWTSQPDFNPAGNRIVFVKGFPGDARSTLWQMRPDGRRLRRLAPMRANGGGYAEPSFSPDGRKVVVELTGDAKFSKLQVIRLRDLSWGATLGGRRMGRSPDTHSPVWVAW
jgi:TolB protein